MSLNLRHEVDTKNLEYLMVDNKQEPWYDSKPSADGKKTVWISIFEVNASIYFICSNIFCGVLIKSIEDVLV